MSPSERKQLEEARARVKKIAENAFSWVGSYGSALKKVGGEVPTIKSFERDSKSLPSITLLNPSLAEVKRRTSKNQEVYQFTPEVFDDESVLRRLFCVAP